MYGCTINASSGGVCGGVRSLSSSIVGTTLSYDKRDSSIDPREGYNITVETHFAGLGGDVKYLQGQLSGGYYYPLTKDVTLSTTQLPFAPRRWWSAKYPSPPNLVGNQ